MSRLLSQRRSSLNTKVPITLPQQVTRKRWKWLWSESCTKNFTKILKSAKSSMISMSPAPWRWSSFRRTSKSKSQSWLPSRRRSVLTLAKIWRSAGRPWGLLRWRLGNSRSPKPPKTQMTTAFLLCRPATTTRLFITIRSVMFSSKSRTWSLNIWLVILSLNQQGQMLAGPPQPNGN